MPVVVLVVVSQLGLEVSPAESALEYGDQTGRKNLASVHRSSPSQDLQLHSCEGVCVCVCVSRACFRGLHASFVCSVLIQSLGSVRLTELAD